jgi:hypothetical protein
MELVSKGVGVDEANELDEGNPPLLQIMSRPELFIVYTRPFSKIIWSLFKFAEEIFSIANYDLPVL